MFCYREGVINLDTEIAYRAFNLLVVPQQKLHCPQIAGAAADECCFGSASECVSKKLGSSPMLAVHWQTNRAFCRVVISRSRPTKAAEEELAWLFAGRSGAAVDRFLGLLRDLKPDALAGPLLAHRSTIDA